MKDFAGLASSQQTALVCLMDRAGDRDICRLGKRVAGTRTCVNLLKQ